MKPTMRRFIRYLLPALAAVAFVLWLVAPREQLLLRKSTRVAALESWTYKDQLGPHRTYSWLSDHEVLHTVPSTSPPGMRAAYFDIKTIEDRPTPGLNTVIGENNHRITWTISPDGKNITLPARVGTHEMLRSRFTPSADFLGPSRAARSELSGYWMTSDRWITLHFRSGHGMSSTHPILEGWVYSMDSGKPVSVSALSEDVSYAAAKFGASIRAASGKLYSLIDANPNGGRLPYLAVESVPIKPGEPAKYALEFPPGWRCYSHWVAPSGTRILWLLTAGPQPRASGALARWFPWLQGNVGPRSGLWVSDANGANFREIGHVYDDSRGSQYIEQVHWVPGEKRVSFLYKDALYTAPAD